MATLIIGSSSSACGDCQGAYASATPVEAGHFTMLGYNRELNGKPGCGALWDRVSLPYTVGEPRDVFIARIKDYYTELAGIPDENWEVFSYGA